jgi:Cu(I)/Ag(I) efflux system membrane protein CusA/SilA
LRAADLFRYVETGIGGSTVGITLEGRERRPLQVRLERADREDIDKLGDILVPTPAGPHIPLGQLATIKRVVGPSEIQSENGRLRVFVQANVADRDLGGFVDEIRERVGREVTLSPGMSIDYSGQYENQLRARTTLAFVMPLVLLIIFVLLAMVFRSVAEAAHVILAVPFALTGGVFLQAALGYNFSVAVWVGYIALFGTAIQTGVVMVVYLEEAVTKKLSEVGAVALNGPGALEGKRPYLSREQLIAAVKEGARLRLRPKVMTVATAVASLLPIFWVTRTGTEIMRPIAAPVIGGMLSSLIHILIVTPVIFLWLRERKLAAVQKKIPSTE